jgi:hypothetical protein
MMAIFTITIQAELVLPYTAYEHTIQHNINYINILYSIKIF